MPERDRPGPDKEGRVGTILKHYLLFVASLLAGAATMCIMCFGYLTLRLSTLEPRWMKSILGYDVIDYGTPWQWTFNILLWGSPALPMCRWILGFINGIRPRWRRITEAYVLFGLWIYVLGFLAYRTDIDRAVLAATGLAIVLTVGFVYMRHRIIVR